ncbi:MAG: hypothetical protein DRJ68_03560 [Thermoprotei archaeon]|nr:MAG: hypothetical protein DRJ62_06835 [Thermoprotei archaeon]RLF21411.1 MAG: hypothetical protein DRJ68_03560 [Thermoprotei archaeon]
MTPLAFTREGRLVRVVEVRGGRGLTRRLAEVGFTPGSTLRVVSSSRGPVVVELCYSSASRCSSCGSCWRLALSFGLAMKVMVEEVESVERT